MPRRRASTGVHKYLYDGASWPLHMGPVDVFLRVSFAGFAAILATVSVQSYARHRERRLLLLTSGLASFLPQGISLVNEIAATTGSSVGDESPRAQLRRVRAPH